MKQLAVAFLLLTPPSLFAATAAVSMTPEKALGIIINSKPGLAKHAQFDEAFKLLDSAAPKNLIFLIRVLWYQQKGAPSLPRVVSEEEIVQAIKDGANIHQVYAHAWVPLHYALVLDSQFLIPYLLHVGAKPDERASEVAARYASAAGLMLMMEAGDFEPSKTWCAKLIQKTETLGETVSYKGALEPRYFSASNRPFVSAYIPRYVEHGLIRRYVTQNLLAQRPDLATTVIGPNSAGIPKVLISMILAYLPKYEWPEHVEI